MRGLPFDIEKGARPMCYTCMRPSSHCMCNLVSPFQAHTNILILQHPNERKKYYSTAKIVTKAITNSKLLRGVIFEGDVINKHIKSQKTYLLYPSSDAKDCGETDLDLTNTVIVLDGTWSEAKQLLRKNPFLNTLPTLTFKQPFQSNYLIRKQPKENYLSSLESIGHLLKLNIATSGKEASDIEKKIQDYNGLFKGFSEMVERQHKYFPRRGVLRTPSLAS